MLSELRCRPYLNEHFLVCHRTDFELPFEYFECSMKVPSNFCAALWRFAKSEEIASKMQDYCENAKYSKFEFGSDRRESEFWWRQRYEMSSKTPQEWFRSVFEVLACIWKILGRYGINAENATFLSFFGYTINKCCFSPTQHIGVLSELQKQ